MFFDPTTEEVRRRVEELAEAVEEAGVGVEVRVGGGVAVEFADGGAVAEDGDADVWAYGEVCVGGLVGGGLACVGGVGD